MLRSLPPAGNPILLTPSKNPEEVFQAAFGNYSVFLYGSGTMALAAALVAAKENFLAQRKIDFPEVLLPAYACPDLVSAALYAGLKPVLIDLAPDTPWMDLDILQARLSHNTVAVIAAHFLGIPERLMAIRKILAGTNTLLIEDSAQLFPAGSSDGVWQGDFVTLSFGRGKPVSLLGGGAVLCRDSKFADHLPLARDAGLGMNQGDPGLPYRIKIILYNNLLSPIIYGLLQNVPFLGLGKTVYEPLHDITLFNRNHINLLAENIETYRIRVPDVQRWIKDMLASIGGDLIIDLTHIAANKAGANWLRYPLLLKEAEARDNLLRHLTRSGLGCSQMYPKPLQHISGLEKLFMKEDDNPQAASFAQRLLTLPCHCGVTLDDVDRMQTIFEKIIN